ncbi:hypothetical protein LCGC14_2146610 [marine sediment metagenome]|uniref:Uncharacterized protein n=1 Tax=marine sediment metagenome TaxID=412755 RepID=A0A0F9GT54_9ZZZZ
MFQQMHFGQKRYAGNVSKGTKIKEGRIHNQPDIKSVENDNTETVLMDLIGLLASKALLNQDDAIGLMDRIVKIEKGKT